MRKKTTQNVEMPLENTKGYTRFKITLTLYFHDKAPQKRTVTAFPTAQSRNL